MDKKVAFTVFNINRFLILTCAVLTFGTIFGTSMLKIIPNIIVENLYGLISKEPTNLINLFIDKFSVPFFTLVGLYFSGTGIFGKFTALFIIFLNGTFYGIENAIIYNFAGTNYIINSFINFIILTLLIDFLLIIMSENSIFSSILLLNSVSKENGEKPHYNAKKITVKFISFTVIFIIICLIYVYFNCFIQSVL